MAPGPSRISEQALIRFKRSMEALGVAKWKALDTDGIVTAVGYDKLPPVLVAPNEIAEPLITMHNEAIPLVFEVERTDRWRMLTLQLAALIYVKRGPNEALCNVCGMVNSHLPSCRLKPFLQAIAELAKEESRDQIIG